MTIYACNSWRCATAIVHLHFAKRTSKYLQISGAQIYLHSQLIIQRKDSKKMMSLEFLDFVSNSDMVIH